MVRDEQDAWDIAQEAFVKAWQAIDRFEGRSSFYSWLYSLTMNVTIDFLRLRRRREEVELNDAIPSSLLGPRVNCQHAEIQAQFNAALAKLSPEQRELLLCGHRNSPHREL
jgi:RNA polymerase sigma-70 factor, ECF subfamily